jgi:hypothetical protein
MRETTIEGLYLDIPREEIRARGFAFSTGWKCLSGGTLTPDADGKTFPTLEAARFHGKSVAFNKGLGRRIFLADAGGNIYRTWRIRLGPDYRPGGHLTGWGLY